VGVGTKFQMIKPFKGNLQGLMITETNF